jgi:hypothetical protein
MEGIDRVRDYNSDIGLGDSFTRKTEYTQVHAVLIAWSEDDIGPEKS